MARPKYTGQTVKVYFGEIEVGAAGSSDSTILAESDMLDSFFPNTDAAFTHWFRVVTVPAAGTYRLQFLCTSTSDKATAFDNVRLGKKPFWQVDTCNGDLYHRYAHAAASNNILTGSTCEETSVNRGGTSNASFTNPNSFLTDGDVLFPWVYYGDSYIPKVYSIQSGTLAWTFPAADIREIAVFSRWGDGNRDGIKVGGVYVMLEGSGEWTKLDVADFSYGVGNANSSPGALCAVLNRTDGGLLAERATGLKIEFPSGQDNNYTGYAEIAAYATSPRDYAWTGAAGNQLVSDAGNWNDSATGAAAGEAGETFAPADFDTLSFPASAEAVVDAPLNVFAVRLDSGVTLANPSGGSVTNTITLGKVSNSGDSAATVSCKTAFTEGYTVSFASPVVFAGGATADALGFISGDAGRVFSGDIALSGAMELTIDSEHVLTAGSRLSASALHKRDAANMQAVVSIEEGAYAHFGTVTCGRDQMHVSLRGELVVDDYFTTMCCFSGGRKYEGDFGYSTDSAYDGGILRAGGLRREDYSTNSKYPDDYSRIYPANVYIGANGISQTTSDKGIEIAGCAKHLYATADFSICGPNASSGELLLNADTTIDTDGHTVIWTSAISGSSQLTKTGEGMLVMAPCTSSGFTGGIAVTEGEFAVLGSIATGGAFSLAGESVLVFSNIVSTATSVTAQSLAVSGGDASVRVDGETLANGTYPLLAVAEGVIPAAALSLPLSGCALPSGKNVFLSLSEDSKTLLLQIYGNGDCAWTGKGADGNFSTAANWLGGIVPDQGGERVYIPNTAKTLVNDLSAFSPASITFTGSEAVTISGNAITGILAVTNLSSGVHHEIAAPVTFAENAVADITTASNPEDYLKWTGGMTAYTFKKHGANPGDAGNIHFIGLVTVTKNHSDWGGYREIDHFFIHGSGSQLTIPNSVVQKTSPVNFSIKDAGAKVCITGDLVSQSSGFGYEIIGTLEVSGWVVKNSTGNVHFSQAASSGHIKAYGIKENTANQDGNFVLTSTDNINYPPHWVLGAGGIGEGLFITHDASSGAGELKTHIYAYDDFAIKGTIRLGYKTDDASRWPMLHIHTEDVDGTNPRTVTLAASFTSGNTKHPCLRILGSGTFFDKNGELLPKGVEVYEPATYSLLPGKTAGSTFALKSGAIFKVPASGNATLKSANISGNTTLAFNFTDASTPPCIVFSGTPAFGSGITVSVTTDVSLPFNTSWTLTSAANITDLSKFTLDEETAKWATLSVSGGNLVLTRKPQFWIRVR